jgi:2'-5' RNA ligase
MHRLFVALRPPRPMRDALLDAMGEIEGARWQNDEQLHLTLTFIGAVDRHVAEDAAAVLGSVSHPPFDLKLDGIGSFDRKGRIVSIWASVTPHDRVSSLHAAISRALVRVGIYPEQRAFVPHITLARFSAGQATVAGLPVKRFWPSPIEGHFDHFLLYESELGASGSTYSAINRYPLL